MEVPLPAFPIPQPQLPAPVPSTSSFSSSSLPSSLEPHSPSPRSYLRSHPQWARALPSPFPSSTLSLSIQMIDIGCRVLHSHLTVLTVEGRLLICRGCFSALELLTLNCLYIQFVRPLLESCAVLGWDGFGFVIFRLISGGCRFGSVGFEEVLGVMGMFDFGWGQGFRFCILILQLLLGFQPILHFLKHTVLMHWGIQIQYQNFLLPLGVQIQLQMSSDPVHPTEPPMQGNMSTDQVAQIPIIERPMSEESHFKHCSPSTTEGDKYMTVQDALREDEQLKVNPPNPVQQAPQCGWQARDPLMNEMSHSIDDSELVSMPAVLSIHSRVKKLKLSDKFYGQYGGRAFKFHHGPPSAKVTKLHLDQLAKSYTQPAQPVRQSRNYVPSVESSFQRSMTWQEPEINPSQMIQAHIQQHMGQTLTKLKMRQPQRSTKLMKRIPRPRKSQSMGMIDPRVSKPKLRQRQIIGLQKKEVRYHTRMDSQKYGRVRVFNLYRPTYGKAPVDTLQTYEPIEKTLTSITQQTAYKRSVKRPRVTKPSSQKGKRSMRHSQSAEAIHRSNHQLPNKEQKGQESSVQKGQLIMNLDLPVIDIDDGLIDEYKLKSKFKRSKLIKKMLKT